MSVCVSECLSVCVCVCVCGMYTTNVSVWYWKVRVMCWMRRAEFLNVQVIIEMIFWQGLPFLTTNGNFVSKRLGVPEEICSSKGRYSSFCLAMP